MLIAENSGHNFEGDGAFSKEAWKMIKPIRLSIHELPLLRELSRGTLSADVFKHYIQQDMLYLKEYARALAIVASKAPDSEQMLRFLNSSQKALMVEQGLHSDFLRSFRITPEEMHNAMPSPSGFAYTSFIMSVVQSSSYGVGLAAILPCFWIYWDVGERLKNLPKIEGNPYQAWIDTYGDEQFAKGARAVIDLTDRAASMAAPHERKSMLANFNRAAQYEWMFWQTASELENWRI